jgi:hypothetical protein
VRTEARSRLLAVALDQVTPVLGPGVGDLTLQLSEANEIYERAIESGRAELLAMLGRELTGITKIILSHSGDPAAPPASRRATAESVKAEVVATLRKKDAVLGAAIDALDLELIE